MIGWTLCSGIGAPELASPSVDWRLASEIEAFPREVLQHRFGYRLPVDHNQGDPLLWGDFTEITPDLARERGIPLPEIMVAGTPCQAFSVAGLRNGLDDARGNLTLKFVEILHAIAAARPDGRLAALWENVPGVLSDDGNAFGCFLGGIVGAMDAIPEPAGGGWPSEGMVEGPRARVAWAVLDAQWFGVAQRRRRVFAVIDFGNAIDPAAVLLEPDRLRGHSAPRRETGESVAGTFKACASSGGWSNSADHAAAGYMTPIRNQLAGAALVPAVSMCINAGAMGRIDGETETFIPVHEPYTIMERGRDGGSNLEWRHDGTANAILCPNGGRGGMGVGAVVFDTTQITSPGNYSNPQPGDPCHPLTSSGDAPSIAFNSRMSVPQWDFDMSQTLTALNPTAVATPWAVRRLTPTECERLQGMPDGHTAIERKGKDAADGPRYKAIGNSMAVPCIKWIMDRMIISMENHK